MIARLYAKVIGMLFLSRCYSVEEEWPPSHYDGDIYSDCELGEGIGGFPRSVLKRPNGSSVGGCLNPYIIPDKVAKLLLVKYPRQVSVIENWQQQWKEWHDKNFVQKIESPNHI